jgi:FtsJ-like methyltransferase
VTKIFRSRDYTALLYAFRQLFARVDATKPQASRGTSAEIFVVCGGFKAPAKIDPRLLDHRTLFQVWFWNMCSLQGLLEAPANIDPRLFDHSTLFRICHLPTDHQNTSKLPVCAHAGGRGGAKGDGPRSAAQEAWQKGAPPHWLRRGRLADAPRGAGGCVCAVRRPDADARGRDAAAARGRGGRAAGRGGDHCGTPP